MENSGSIERRRHVKISRSGRFKDKHAKKRSQITDEIWIDPVQSSKVSLCYEFEV